MSYSDKGPGPHIRVGLDIAPLADRNLTGIPLYVESLVRELLRPRGEDQKEERYVLVGNRQGNVFPDLLARRGLRSVADSAPPARLVRGWDVRIGPLFPAVAASSLGWATRKLDGRLLNHVSRALTNAALLANGRPLDVFHHTSLMRVARARARRHIVTIYDLSTRFYPEAHRPGNIAAWERVFAFAQERADLVITDSESARNDVIEVLRIPAERVRAISLAVRPTLPAHVDAEAVDAVRRKYGLGGGGERFVLAVGSLDPRKNLPRLIEAFGRLMAEQPAELKDVRLVLTGAREHGTTAIQDAITRHRLAGERIVLTGYVDDADLAALMTGCACFAYPSLYEGFGLPVLEAMALGAPVVTSNVSSLPEVAGDAALLISPRDAEALRVAIHRVLTDEVLAADLRRRGIHRAAQFSWARTADAHRSVYHEVAADG